MTKTARRSHAEIMNDQRNTIRKLDETVRDGRFSVIDMGDDGKVADMTQIDHL